MTTVIVVDDHQIFRESLCELLTKQGFKIIAYAENGKKFISLLDQHQPDVVVMDIDMPELNGYDAAKKAIEMYPDLKILTLSGFGEEKYYYKMVEAGVKGFVLKNAGINELKQAIVEINNGGSWFSTDLLQKVIISIHSKPSEELNSQLSKNEIDIIRLICQGHTMDRIATELNLSIDNILTLRDRLLVKTKCQNAPALVLYAIKNKLIQL